MTAVAVAPPGTVGGVNATEVSDASPHCAAAGRGNAISVAPTIMPVAPQARDEGLMGNRRGGRASSLSFRLVEGRLCPGAQASGPGSCFPELVRDRSGPYVRDPHPLQARRP